MAAKPSSEQVSYLVPQADDVTLAPIMTTGNAVGIKLAPDSQIGEPWRMPGTPDGLGAFDNNNGTMTVLMNHELEADEGTVRAHGSTGAFVSRVVVDTDTLEVLGADDLIKDVHLWNEETGTWDEGTTAFDRLCSADLPEQTAFFNPETNKGYAGGRIFLNGEESGIDGRAFAHFATGKEAGNTYELVHLGQFSHENQVANPHAMDKTVVVGLDDSSPGQVYVYVGDKQTEGTPLEKAGLAGGSLFGIAVEDQPDEDRETGFGEDEVAFQMVDLGDASTFNGETLQSRSEDLGVTEFLRPEDGHWDPLVEGRFYFVTTDTFNDSKPGAVDPDTAPPAEEPNLPPGVPPAQEQPEDGRSRLWQLDFDDMSDPSQGGTLTMLLDGTEDHQMLDNMTVSQDGKILLQEDPGNVPYLAKIWEYDPNTDEMRVLAKHNPELFGPNADEEAFLTQNEESSGIIDVTDILGRGEEDVYLLDVQAHYDRERELDEGGQLLAMSVAGDGGVNVAGVQEPSTDLWM